MMNNAAKNFNNLGTNFNFWQRMRMVLLKDLKF